MATPTQSKSEFTVRMGAWEGCVEQPPGSSAAGHQASYGMYGGRSGYSKKRIEGGGRAGELSRFSREREVVTLLPTFCESVDLDNQAWYYVD